jgi:tRNA G18 (ribose-2'-O)-methylase SpoU
VVVHNVRSIYNVGSIFRTSDAARIEHLFLTGYTGTPNHNDLHKTALGAQDTVAWSHHDDVLPVLEQHRSEGYTVAALEITDEPTPIAQVSNEQYPLCLVLGNEVQGVDDVIIDRVDLAFEIPQYGAKQSLNVSVAYGIAIFDLVRHFRALKGHPSAPDHSSVSS